MQQNANYRTLEASVSRDTNVTTQPQLMFSSVAPPHDLLPNISPAYVTELGAAYVADSLTILSQLPEGSTNLVVTSPPYALHFSKEYGNAEKHKYIDWFIPFAKEIKRILKDDGSFVLNIGGSYNQGIPTRSIYHFKLLIALVEDTRFPPRTRVLLVQPSKNANASRVGYSPTNPNKGFC